ncbi:RNA-binding protein [Neomegalonema sp.]|uniref:RNA-binding protein n=1 Tax=Neomegalonema sp. TaxID=2039713 RepID=UPI00260FE5DB|nr:RNA-binding protein [Neomegalonema sp.]MDD2869423.1 RNA-binding protein [Neomegalonema sp.]
MGRGGASRRAEEGPSERRCIVHGESAPKTGLIRFVVGPEGALVPDLAERLPGRGIWVSAERSALETAAKKNLFARAARAPVKAPPDLAAQIEALLVRRLVEAIGFARKSGAAVCGFEKTREAALRGRLAALMAASDGAEGGRAKLRPLAAGLPILSVLTSDELGLAFGREFVIHAALENGGASDRAIREALRLQGFRAEAPEPVREDGGGFDT